MSRQPLERICIHPPFEAGKQLERSAGPGQAYASLGQAAALRAAAAFGRVDAVPLTGRVGKDAHARRHLATRLDFGSANPGVIDERALGDPPEIEIEVDRRA